METPRLACEVQVPKVHCEFSRLYVRMSVISGLDSPLESSTGVFVHYQLIIALHVS